MNVEAEPNLAHKSCSLTTSVVTDGGTELRRFAQLQKNILEEMGTYVPICIGKDGWKASANGPLHLILVIME